MGLFDFIKRTAGRVFRGVKNTGKKILRGVTRGLQRGARAVTNVIDPINEAAKKIASKLDVNIPLVGNPLERLKQIPVFGKAFRALAGVSNGIDAIEAFGKGDEKQAIREMKDVAKNLAPKQARRVLKLVDRLT